jgi:hypothetical protein
MNIKKDVRLVSQSRGQCKRGEIEMLKKENSQKYTLKIVTNYITKIVTRDIIQ